MTKQADLSAYLCDGQPGPFSEVLVQWMEASARFTAFAETYHDKIRKKIRVNRAPESMLDLRAELEVAYCLLNNRRLSVAYEPYASAKGAAPIFAVTYRDNLAFNIEVARLHADAGLNDRLGLLRKEEHILRILLDKLGQMQPGMANLLVIFSGQELAKSIDLGGFMQRVKTRAEGKDPSFYSGSRFKGPAVFYKEYLHLSGILLWAPAAQVWVNRQARPGLPDNVFLLVSRLPLAENP